MLFDSMADNYRYNQSVHQTYDINTTPINSLYQNFIPLFVLKLRINIHIIVLKPILLQIEMFTIVLTNV